MKLKELQKDIKVIQYLLYNINNNQNEKEDYVNYITECNSKIYRMRRSGRPCSTIQDIAAGLHDISYL